MLTTRKIAETTTTVTTTIVIMTMFIPEALS